MFAIAASTVLRTSEGFALRGSVAKHPGPLWLAPLRETPIRRTRGAFRTRRRKATRSPAPRSAKQTTGVLPSSGGELSRPADGGGKALTAYTRLKGRARGAAKDFSK